jgi:energy-coupling factor transporter ATP-binding protein EcfA2
MDSTVHITDIDIQTMWGDTSLVWHNLDPQINIIVGQNGFGKTTMLNLIKSVLTKDDKFCKMLKAKVQIKTTAGEMTFDGKQIVHKPNHGGFASANCFHYVNTFDVPASKKSSFSQLGISLDSVLYQRTPTVYSFSDYRLSMLNDLSTAMQKQERINKLDWQTHRDRQQEPSRIPQRETHHRHDEPLGGRETDIAAPLHPLPYGRPLDRPPARRTRNLAARRVAGPTHHHDA